MHECDSGNAVHAPHGGRDRWSHCRQCSSALLYLEGRPAWCKSGLAFWSAAWTSCTSQNFLDPYSLSHVLHGVILFWLLRPLAERVSLPWRMVAAVALEIGWELLENSPWVIARYRQDTAALDYTGDSILNSHGRPGVGDRRIRRSRRAFRGRCRWRCSSCSNCGCSGMARDNLTLNVLMLFYPIDAIKEWQLSGHCAGNDCAVRSFVTAYVSRFRRGDRCWRRHAAAAAKFVGDQVPRQRARGSRQCERRVIEAQDRAALRRMPAIVRPVSQSRRR